MALQRQVTPDKKLIIMDMEVLETDKEEKTLTAEARLWVDDLKIYHIPKISLRLIEDDTAGKKTKAHDIAKELYLEPSDIIIDKKSGKCLNLPLNEIHFDQQNSLQISYLSLTDTHKDKLTQNRTNKNKDIAGIARLARLAIDWEIALVNKFLRRIVLQDPEGYHALQSSPVLYLANHQNFIEPFGFGIIANLLGRLKLKILGKEGHKDTWVGALNNLGQELFQDSALTHLLTFNTKKPEELFKVLEKYRRNYSPDSLLVFVEGKRLYTAGQQITKISSAIIDFAIKLEMPIIPVRFAGGLPLDNIGNTKEKVDFTYGYGHQDCYLGKAIFTDELQKLNLKERSALILNKINTLAAELDEQGLLNQDKNFADRVQMRMNNMNISESGAVFIEALMDYPDKSPESETLLNTIINKSTNNFDKDSLEYKLYQFIMGT